VEVVAVNLIDAIAFLFNGRMIVGVDITTELPDVDAIVLSS